LSRISHPAAVTERHGTSEGVAGTANPALKISGLNTNGQALIERRREDGWLPADPDAAEVCPTHRPLLGLAGVRARKTPKRATVQIVERKIPFIRQATSASMAAACGTPRVRYNPSREADFGDWATPNTPTPGLSNSPTNLSA
jgi:hypothetical protein